MSEALSIMQNATEGKYAADKTEVRTLLACRSGLLLSVTAVQTGDSIFDKFAWPGQGLADACRVDLSRLS